MHLGIITCEILRNEIRELIRTTGVRDVFFVVPDAANSVTVVHYHGIIERFSRALAKDKELNLRSNTLPRIMHEIQERALQDSIIVKVFELQQHLYPQTLLIELRALIERLSAVAEVIILGYGLCGSSAADLEQLIHEARVPVLIPRGRNGAILNNCIEIALGREEVVELLAEEAGTFFMTPAGASIIQEPQVVLESTITIMAGRMKQHAAGDTQRVIKLMKNHYHRVVKIWFTEADLKDEDYAHTVENFARKFNLAIKPLQGSSQAMYELAERARRGRQ
jgi:hypothetical protein